MDDRILDYIKELELELKNAGKSLPKMREDVAHLLVYEE